MNAPSNEFRVAPSARHSRARGRFRAVAMGLAAALSAGLAAESALAQRGQYRGPYDEVRSPATSDSRAGGVSTGGGAEPTGPPPSSAGGATPGGRPGTAVPGGGRRRFLQDPEQHARWEFWWEFNKDRYLSIWNLENRQRAEIFYGSPEFYLGAIDKNIVSSLAEIDKETRVQRIVPILIDALKARDPDVRASAVIALGKVGDPSHYQLVKQMTSDSDIDVRQATLLALGLLGDIQAVPYLLTILNSATVDSAMRVHAALGLGLVRQEQVTLYLVDFLEKNVFKVGSGIDEVQVASIIALGINGDRRAVEPMARWLRDSRLRDGPVRVNLLTSLGKLGDARAMPFIIQALEKSDIEARRAAAIALGELNYSPASEGEIMTLMARREEWAGRDALTSSALEALDRIIKEKTDKTEAERRSLSRLRDIAARAAADALSHDGDLSVRNFSAVTLGKIGGPLAREALLAALGSGYSKQLQAHAAIGLGLLGDRTVAPELVARLEEYGEDSFKGALAIGLGLLREKTAVDPLRKIVDSKGADPDLRGYAAIGIGLIGDRAVVPALVQLAADERGKDDLVRSVAIALGLLGDASNVADLKALVAEGRPREVKGAAAIAFGLLRESASIDPLAALLSARGVDAEAMSVAVAALGYVGDRAEVPRLSAIVRDQDYRLAVPNVEDVFLIL